MKKIMPTPLQKYSLFGASFLLMSFSLGKTVIIEDSTEVFEQPRSQIKTYLQKSSIDQNLKPVKQSKPGALSDEELVAIPERYLPPELKTKQREIKARLKAKKSSDKPAQVFAQSPSGLPQKESETVRIRTKSNRILDIKIENAVWVPPTAATDDALLAPQQKLPDVEILNTLEVTTSGQVKKEIEAGDFREMTELFEQGKTQEKSKTPLLEAYRFYAEKDFATSLTLALGVFSEKNISSELKVHARFLAAHSLFQSGFYASSVSHLVELVNSKYRRSAIGMLAKCLDKTKDESAANQVLAKVSISQIPDQYQSTFSFHLGRILLSSGAREASLSAFNRVPADHSRYPEAQYFMGVIRASEVPASVNDGDWDNEKSLVYTARSHFETAITASRAAELKGDLINLIRISLARLSYQAKQYNQSLFYYSEVDTESPFSRESLYEGAWALYRIGEYNRSLGLLHALNTKYYEGRDLAELWILRSLSYLKLCRFDEARIASGQFEYELSKQVPQLQSFLKQAKTLDLPVPSKIQSLEAQPWLVKVLVSDSVVKKDFLTERLVLEEKSRLKNLSTNLRVADAELRTSVQKVLEAQLDKKLKAVAKALRPYIESRVSDILNEYKAQKDRLDFLKFEIYSQAQKFPKALERPEARKQLDSGEFLPGVFLKGHEILWRFSGEFWYDELRSYDYFLPTECKNEVI
jgi:hypothetical protein